MPLTPRTIITTMQPRRSGSSCAGRKTVTSTPTPSSLPTPGSPATPAVSRKSRAESQRTLERMIRHWDDHGIGLFSAVREEDDQVLGRVGFLVWDAESWRHAMLRPPRGKTETEIGWTLGRAHWGRGYATEAATAARDWAVRELG